MAETDEFAVGMPVTGHPPLRSGRDQFRHSTTGSPVRLAAPLPISGHRARVPLRVSVKPLLRGQPADARLAEMIRGNVHAKWEGHEINTSRFIKPQRTMHAIGG